nr:immunoglobulin heavy chain junction region [Mus musculus]
CARRGRYDGDYYAMDYW